MLIFTQKKNDTYRAVSSVEDPRSRHGLRHPLADVLFMCIMVMTSGYQGYREIGRFMERNQKELRKTFLLLHKVPACMTARKILQSVDFEKFFKVFNRWALQYVPKCRGDTKAIDGKATGSTVSSCFSSCQNFVSLVPVFSAQRGIALRYGKIENKKESGIPAVRQLIRSLDVREKSLRWMTCAAKKMMGLIVLTDNHCVIQVKANADKHIASLRL